MEAVVQLEREIAGLYHGGAGQPSLPDTLRKMKHDLDDELARLGLSLRPMHPDIEDTELARYFTLVGGSIRQDETTLVALRDLDAVTAAYMKPEAELA